MAKSFKDVLNIIGTLEMTKSRMRLFLAQKLKIEICVFYMKKDKYFLI